MNRALIVATVLSLMAAIPAGAENTGKVVMQDGSVVLGEFKSLTQGQLTYSTGNMGTLTIVWDAVATIVDKKEVLVEMRDGTLYEGVMEDSTESRQVALRTDGGPTTLAMDEIFDIDPLVKSRFRGLKGSFSLGASYTKSSDSLQLSASGDVSKRTTKSLRSLSLNAISTTQSGGTTQNINAGYAHLKQLPGRWTVPLLATYERNQSLGIENRFLGAVGGGRWFLESDRNELVGMAGVDVNHEVTVGTDGDQTTLEAFLALRFSRNRYHHLKESFALSVAVYPGLTDSGRFRSQLNAHWRQEFFVAFLYFELSIYGIYDNRPPQGAVDTTDFGIVTSIGYSFSP